MGSSRLPGKVLMKIDGDKTVLSYTMDQLRFCRSIDKIVIATTTLKEDEEIVDFARKNNTPCYRGDPDNVLDRYYNCAKEFGFAIIIRITADCPLIDPQVVDMVVKKFKENSFDYVTNCLKRTYPYGTEVEVFSVDALNEAHGNAKLPSEKEHVTPYIKNHKEKFKIHNIEYKEDLSKFRWVVDRENDLILVKKLIEKIKQRPILMNHIITILVKEPDLWQINNKNIPDEGFLKSLKDDEKFLRNQK